MVSFTPGYGWPIPSLADIADGPDAFADALTAIETTFGADEVLSYTPVWSGSLANPAAWTSIVGRYRARNGVCDLWIGITFGASTTGGSGALTLTVPLPARTGAPQNWLPCKLYHPPTVGQYIGGAILAPGDPGGLRPQFPKSNTDNRVDSWTNEATIGSGAGTGVPAISGDFPVRNGGDFYLSGQYLI